MIIRFAEDYLLELYTTGKCSSKKHRFQPSVVANYIRRVDALTDAPNVEALFTLNS